MILYESETALFMVIDRLLRVGAYESGRSDDHENENASGRSTEEALSRLSLGWLPCQPSVDAHDQLFRQLTKDVFEEHHIPIIFDVQAK